MLLATCPDACMQVLTMKLCTTGCRSLVNYLYLIKCCFCATDIGKWRKLSFPMCVQAARKLSKIELLGLVSLVIKWALGYISTLGFNSNIYIEGANKVMSMVK